MRLFAVLGCVLVLLMPGRACGLAMRYATFCGQVQASAFIVEGVVESQIEINHDRHWEGFYYRKQSALKVSRAYKGDVRAGDTLTVLSQNTFVCDVSRLESGRSYFLFLKRTDEGLVDVASGQGTYEIIVVGRDTQVAVNRYGYDNGGVRVDRLRSNIRWAVNRPTSQPAEPTVTAEQAEAIADKAIQELDFSLENYDRKRATLRKNWYECLGTIGNGDPVWVVEWKVKGDICQAGGPPDSVQCYIHARTGRHCLAPEPLNLEHTTAEDVVRVYLATRKEYPSLQQDARGPIRIRPLSEGEFRERVPRLIDLNDYSRVKASYYPGTTFWAVDTDSGSSLIVVLQMGRRVDYIGEFIPESQSTTSGFKSLRERK